MNSSGCKIVHKSRFIVTKLYIICHHKDNSGNLQDTLHVGCNDILNCFICRLVFDKNRENDRNEVFTMCDDGKETINSNDFMLESEDRSFCHEGLNDHINIVLYFTL